MYGSILDKEGKVIHHLFGKWNEGIYYGDVQSAKCIWRPGVIYLVGRILPAEQGHFIVIFYCFEVPSVPFGTPADRSSLLYSSFSTIILVHPSVFMPFSDFHLSNLNALSLLLIFLVHPTVLYNPSISVMNYRGCRSFWSTLLPYAILRFPS